MCAPIMLKEFIMTKNRADTEVPTLDYVVKRNFSVL